ncbi:MAG: L,D-transpeptidase family protein [Eubacteriales bacterium]
MKKSDVHMGEIESLEIQEEVEVVETVNIDDTIEDASEESEEATETEEVKDDESEIDEAESDEAEVEEVKDDELEDDEAKDDESEDDEAKDDESESDESEHKEVVENEDASDKKQEIGKLLLKIFGILLAILIVIYLGISVCFSQIFFYGTSIDGVDYSLKFVEDVEDAQEAIVDNYTLTLYTLDGLEEHILADSIDLDYVDTDEIEAIKSMQNPFLWPEMFFETYEYTTTIIVEYDQDELEKTIAELDCMVEANMTEPTDAYPEFQGTSYVIMPDEYGTKIDTENFISAVGEALLAFQPSLDMLEAGCYAIAEHTADSEEIIALTEELNSYLEVTITYEEGVVLDEETIASWLIIEEDYSVTFPEENITEFVAELAADFDTVDTVRYFESPDGKEVEVSGGSYGWLVDQEAEVEQILLDLSSGESVTREITYSKRGISHGDTDWGDTYAEVDISEQKMWFILDGEVVMESDVVTGQAYPSSNHTPQGIYTLTYKTSPAVLRGELLADGTRSYESPVTFWMPFNGGIGFHDASWRSTYGGEIYTYNGSHGCINMPYAAAEELYSYITTGTPVICHY